MTIVQWIDGFSRQHHKDIIVASLKYCIEKKALRLHAWVIMSNHVHLIVSCRDGKLEDIIRDLKKFTATRIVKAISEDNRESRRRWMLWLFESAGKQNSNNKHYQFWQQDNHPIALVTKEMIRQRLNYIHDNPVRAGIVYDQAHYVYSSGIDYTSCGSGLISIERLD
jgi:REP element-mobilizing transposase RayT